MPEPPRGGMRVLVIDDNPDDRQLVLREAEALFPGLEAVAPIDRAGFEAAMAAVPAPDLVVTDLDLRWWSGRDVLAAVKARHPACAVVMFTGSGDEQTAADLMKQGLDDYVVKSPRQLPRLRASLKLAVEAARNRQALAEREAQLAAALAHKETVIRELHHRVKNNLQTMTSLLQLRGRRADAATREVLDDLAGRLRALGAVQAGIYETEDLDRVDFRRALEEVARSLAATYGNGNVRLDLKADPLELTVARAMPLALLCYELILNALKHAWPEGGKGRLKVRLSAHGRGPGPTVVIEDDGAGFVGESVVKGMGLRLVEALAAEARAEVETASQPGDGTAVTLRLQHG